MNSLFVRVTCLIVLISACHPDLGQTQATAASWLDASKPVSWNRARLPIPAAPHIQGPVDARCRSLARPAELEQDKRLQSQGWDLVGPYQGGWQILVIQATAGYDGMCRPRQYQAFVFVRGIFAGTLSPQLMDSRGDGALTHITLEGNNRLSAEYVRYTATDPLCCPSRITSVQFEVASDVPLVRPVSASTSSTH